MIYVNVFVNWDDIVSGAQRSSKLWLSTASFGGDGDNDGVKNSEADDIHDELIPAKREPVPQGVDPKRGWNFRGVHKVFGLFSSQNLLIIGRYSYWLLFLLSEKDTTVPYD